MKFPRLSILALSALSGMASATVVNIDFNTGASPTYSGLGAAPDSVGNNHWNALQNVAGSASATDLNDSTNGGLGVTSIDFSLTGITGTITNPSTEAERSGGYLDLMRDYVYIDSTASNVVAPGGGGSFSGLVVGGTYDLYFYGQGEFMSTTSGSGGFRGQNSFFSVNGGSGQQTGWDGDSDGDGLLVAGIEYVKFTTTAIDGGVLGGVINFTWANVVPGLPTPGNVATDSAATTTGGGARRGVLNGIQLATTPVPEPSAVLLGGLGLLSLLVRRRR